MSKPGDQKESERWMERLIEPYEKSGFVQEIGEYLDAYGEYIRARQSYPPKPEKPTLKPAPDEMWKKWKAKYGEEIYRGYFYLICRPGQRQMSAGSLLHSFQRDGSFPCKHFSAFAADLALPSEMRRVALSFFNSCRHETHEGLAAELAQFAGPEEPDEEVRRMALTFLSRLNEAGSGPEATRILVQSDRLSEVETAVSALWRRPDPAALPALKRALLKARKTRPYPMQSVRTISGGVVACRGTDSVERDVYDAMGDALFWDFRFPDITPPGLLTNIIGPLENSLHIIGTPVSIEYLIRVYIHGGVWGALLDVGPSLRRYLKNLQPAIMADLEPKNPRAIWSIWACRLSRDERCLPALKRLVQDPRRVVARAAVDALAMLEGGREFPDVRKRLAEFEVIPMKEVLDLGDRVEVIKPSPDRSRFSFIRRFADENGSWVLENDLRIRKLADDSVLWTAVWSDGRVPSRVEILPRSLWVGS